MDLIEAICDETYLKNSRFWLPGKQEWRDSSNHNGIPQTNSASTSSYIPNYTLILFLFPVARNNFQNFQQLTQWGKKKNRLVKSSRGLPGLARCWLRRDGGGLQVVLRVSGFPIRPSGRPAGGGPPRRPGARAKRSGAAAARAESPQGNSKPAGCRRGPRNLSLEISTMRRIVAPGILDALQARLSLSDSMTRKRY